MSSGRKQKHLPFLPKCSGRFGGVEVGSKGLDKSERGQAILEATLAIFALCLLLFMMMQLSFFALGLISGYDAAASAVRAAIVDTTTPWNKTTVATNVKNTIAKPLMDLTQPIKSYTIQAWGMNDNNAPKANWGITGDPADSAVNNFPYPRDRQGWLYSMKNGTPLGDNVRIYNIDWQVRFAQPFIFFSKIFGPSFELVTDMAMTRYKDDGRLGNGFVDHRFKAFP